MKYLLLLIIITFSIDTLSQQLTESQAIALARLPLPCISSEYPNKTGHIINNVEEAEMLPSKLHPSFYGCLDWHSSVHGHWMLLKILERYPDISLKDSIISVLDNSFQENKIESEANCAS
jgi:hypothetical protein